MHSSLCTYMSECICVFFLLYSVLFLSLAEEHSFIEQLWRVVHLTWFCAFDKQSIVDSPHISRIFCVCVCILQYGFGFTIVVLNCRMNNLTWIPFWKAKTNWRTVVLKSDTEQRDDEEEKRNRAHRQLSPSFSLSLALSSSLPLHCKYTTLNRIINLCRMSNCLIPFEKWQMCAYNVKWWNLRQNQNKSIDRIAMNFMCSQADLLI